MNSDDPVTIAVKQAATNKDGRMTLECRQAFDLAESHGVPPAKIGQVCNDNRIKIVGCQLGCFK